MIIICSTQSQRTPQTDHCWYFYEPIFHWSSSCPTNLSQHVSKGSGWQSFPISKIHPENKLFTIQWPPIKSGKIYCIKLLCSPIWGAKQLEDQIWHFTFPPDKWTLFVKLLDYSYLQIFLVNQHQRACRHTLIQKWRFDEVLILITSGFRWRVDALGVAKK